LTARTLLPLPCSVADHLAIAEREVAPDLVSRAAWRRLRAIEDPLPPIAEEAALEIRLEADDPRVDFSICLLPSAAQRRRLAEAIARSGVATRSPGWRRAHAFLNAYANTASPLHDTVQALWLEFDAEGPGPPEPFVVFALDGERLYPEGTAATGALVESVRAGIDSLAGGLGPALEPVLEHCLRALPRYAQVLHAAVRPTEAGEIVRLIVRMPEQRVPGALADLGWPGDPRELRSTLQRLGPDTRHLVDLDLTAQGLGRRVGIEFVHSGAPRANPRWKALFDALESHGACAPARRSAIDAWGGEDFGPALGPGVLCLRRDLMVKVIHEPGAPLRAKAYLAFAPRLAVETAN
jgi:hypothetical protein